jgi:hypothetical protein
MKAKKNRYYLGHRELGKPQLYGNGKGASKHHPCTFVIALSGICWVGFANSTSTKTE